MNVILLQREVGEKEHKNQDDSCLNYRRHHHMVKFVYRYISKRQTSNQLPQVQNVTMIATKTMSNNLHTAHDTHFCPENGENVMTKWLELMRGSKFLKTVVVWMAWPAVEWGVGSAWGGRVESRCTYVSTTHHTKEVSR